MLIKCCFCILGFVKRDLDLCLPCSFLFLTLALVAICYKNWDIEYYQVCSQFQIWKKKLRLNCAVLIWWICRQPIFIFWAQSLFKGRACQGKKNLGFVHNFSLFDSKIYHFWLQNKRTLAVLNIKVIAAQITFRNQKSLEIHVWKVQGDRKIITPSPWPIYSF